MANRVPPPPRELNWARMLRTLSFWALLIVGSVALVKFAGGRGQDAVEISYTQFSQQLSDSNIAAVEVTERQQLRGDFRHAIPAGRRTADKFTTLLPFESNDAWVTSLRAKGVDVRAKEPKQSIGLLLMNLWPLLLIAGLMIFMLRQMQQGGNRAFAFGKSKAKLLTGDTPKITFADVAGADEAKQELQEIIEFLRDPQKFTKLGGRLPKGALLVGPPGTGKTLLAKAVAGEAARPFFSMSGSDFVEMFVGVGASRVRDLFEQGKAHAPCIIFIDAIDNDGVILIAAPNRPDVLDPALLRPGRFDRQIVVDAPDLRGREGILKVHLRNKPIAENVDITTLARGTPGMSGADLANMVNEAALLAVRVNHDKIYMSDLEDAKDKVMLGAERKSMVMKEEERRPTAYHEAGHAICAMRVAGTDPLHRVTIVPRGRALGLAFTLPEDDRVSITRQQLEAALVMSYGGRVAEELIFGHDHVTTGAASDIQKATAIARRYVTQWGLSDAIGPILVGDNEQELFLGREIQHRREVSEQTAQLVDAEVKRVIDRSYERARQTLEANIDLLHKVAGALLERETLSREDIEMLARGDQLPPRTSGAGGPLSTPLVPPPVLEPRRTNPPLLGGPAPSPA